MASPSNQPFVSLHTPAHSGSPSDEKLELPKYTNRLAAEQSPYLLQHAHNPVNWYPWGPEAFEAAKRENKPIFLSVGYSTCHWCHVMEHECFENEEIAEVMNELFVNIKVDREERPDVDRVYMGFVEALEGSGGWPMSVFLTPELHPFFGGTYFPPRDQYGRPGFKTVLQRISASWVKSPERAAEAAAGVLADMRRSLSGDEPTDSKDIVTPETASGAATKCLKQLKARFDEEFGGFSSGEAPKFPRSVEFTFLLNFHATNRDSSESATAATDALEMAVKTLKGIANGGMRDHIGGGFHRYSVDRYWHVPHFEKMLYDNAQLTVAFLDAYLVTKDAAMRAVAEDTLQYIARDMTHPQGGIFSAEDADSKDSRSGKKEEGAFYVWTEAEIEAVLGRGAAATELFKWMYYVKREGNCDLSPRSDPHRQFVGRNVLIKRHSVDEAAEHFNMEARDVEDELKKCRDLLFAERAKRPRPSLDDKVVTGLNGLMLSAFSKAHLAIEVAAGGSGTAYLDRAKAVAEFIRRNLTRSDGSLVRSFRTGPSATDAFCDDYAFLIAGLIDLYEASMDSAYLAWALQLQHKQNALFGDRQGGFYDTTDADKSILVRTKNSYDGSEPSPNSVSVMNLLRLGQLAGDQSLTASANNALRAFALRLQQVPLSVPLMVVALSVAASGLRSVVLSASSIDGTNEALRDMRRVLFSRFEAGRTVVALDSGPHFGRLSAINRFYESMRPQDGDLACQAFVCQHFSCSRPVSSAKELEQGLLHHSPPQQ